MPATVRTNAREVAGDMVRLRREFVQGPLALGIGEFLVRVVTRTKTRGYGFTDRTGTLRSSIVSLGVMIQGDRAIGRAGTDVVYSRYVEYVSNDRYSYLRRAVAEIGFRGLQDSITRHVVPWIRRNGFGPGRSQGVPRRFASGGPLGG